MSSYCGDSFAGEKWLSLGWCQHRYRNRLWFQSYLEGLDLGCLEREIPEISRKALHYLCSTQVCGDAIHCSWLKNFKSLENLGVREREMEEGEG